MWSNKLASIPVYVTLKILENSTSHFYKILCAQAHHSFIGLGLTLASGLWQGQIWSQAFNGKKSEKLHFVTLKVDRYRELVEMRKLCEYSTSFLDLFSSPESKAHKVSL